MTEAPKCPHGCDAPQTAGVTFYEAGRWIPTHRNKRGETVLGRYENVLMRWWSCTKCGKNYPIDEPEKKAVPINKKLAAAAKGKKRGKKPKKRKSSKAN